MLDGQTHNKYATQKEKAKNSKANQIFKKIYDEKYSNTLTQNKFAEMIRNDYHIKVADSTVRGWLNFQSPITSKFYPTIAELCDCTKEYLTGEIETRNQKEARKEHHNLQKQNLKEKKKLQDTLTQIKEAHQELQKIRTDNRYLEATKLLSEDVLDCIVETIHIIEQPVIEDENIYLDTKNFDYLNVIRNIFSNQKLLTTIIFETGRIVDYFTNKMAYHQYNEYLNENSNLLYKYPTEMPVYDIAEYNISKCLNNIFHNAVKDILKGINFDKLDMNNVHKRIIKQELDKYLDNKNCQE